MNALPMVAMFVLLKLLPQLHIKSTTIVGLVTVSSPENEPPHLGPARARSSSLLTVYKRLLLIECTVYNLSFVPSSQTLLDYFKPQLEVCFFQSDTKNLEGVVDSLLVKTKMQLLSSCLVESSKNTI